MSHKQLRTFLVIVFTAHQLVAEETNGEPPERFENYNAIEGDSVTLRCPNKLSIDQTKLTWYKWVDHKWENLKEIYENSQIVEENVDLNIDNVQINHAGEYLCIYSSVFGEKKYVTSLNVIKRTKAVIEHDEAIVDKRVVIKCNVTDYSYFTHKVEWKLNDTNIDFKSETQLLQIAENILLIKNAKLSDSGIYTCVVLTRYPRMPNAIASAEIIVKDVPNAPSASVICRPWEAIIKWKSNGANGAVIQKYTIEYKTSAEPIIWKILTQMLPNKQQTFKFSLIQRWTNYTFRVIAHNRIGSSIPSQPTIICTSEPDCPYENPRGVKGEGTTPTNMVISWEPIPPSMQNGSGFYYRVCWRQLAIVINQWTCEKITNWMQSNFTIDGLPTFIPYEIQVKSVNDIAESYRDDIFIGYSGEDEPTQAPANFQFVNMTNSDTALLQWDPVPIESVNGNITFYVIHIWNDVDGREKAVENMNTQTTIAKLQRATLYYAQIFVKNRIYSGPKSDILEFRTPAPDPRSVQSFEAFPLGSTAFLLKWTKPLQISGHLIGYNIYYGYVDGIAKYERQPQIDNPTTHAKLDGLEPNETYQLCIIPKTSDIEIDIDVDAFNQRFAYCIDANTNAIPKSPIKPNQPSFTWEILSSEEHNVTVKVTWMPDLTGDFSGSHFFVKYRIKTKREWIKTDHIYADDYAIINGLLRSETYEFEVISVDGDQMAESEVQEVSFEQSSYNSATMGIIIFITVVILCSVAVHLYSRRRTRPVQEQNLCVNDFSKTNKGNLHHINSNKLEPVCNRYTFSRIKPTFVERQSRFQVTTAPIYGIHTMNQFPHMNTFTNVSINQADYALEHFVNGNLDHFNPDMTLDEQADTLPYDEKYEFPRERLKLGKQLGVGAFGVVVEATAYSIVPGEDETTVAVKMIKKMANNEVFHNLALELKIMINLGKNLNIVNLLGAITKNIAERELMIIVEYCKFGNLQSFLVKHRQHFVDQINTENDRIDPKITCRTVEDTSGYLLHTSQAPSPSRSVTTSDLVCWSFQIARGMHYLATRKVLHGDLAARNILLAESNVVKICDFGLARSMYRTGNYKIKTERPLPYKWLAVESIGDHVFSTYSDVWSYGIVLWELFSLGAVPYPGMIAGVELFKMLKNGYRMERPDFATHEIYEIMMSCWNATPELRPLFDELADKFSNMLDKNVSAHYIKLNEAFSKDNETRLSIYG